MFYFRWIEPHLRTIKQLSENQGYWQELTKTAGYTAWSGYVFESICYKHLDKIKVGLGLNLVTQSYTWSYAAKKGSEEKGAQIDLLFDRDDGCITLCEIKYTNQPFNIDKAYAATINQKISVFQKETKSTKQIFFAIISNCGLKKTLYSEELIDSAISLESLF